MFNSTPATGFGEDTYMGFAEQISNGNWDLDAGRFIFAPLYPVFLAFFKLVFGSAWIDAVSIVQIILSALTGIYLYKIAEKLFGGPFIPLLSLLLYAFYLPTFYYSYALTTETIYLFFLVIAIYQLIKATSTRELVWFGIAISLAALTKSYIIIFIPFAILYLIIEKKFKWHFALLPLLVFMVMMSPWTIYNLNKHDTLVVSSNGGGFHFYNANSEYGYSDAVGKVYLDGQRIKIKDLNNEQFVQLYQNEEANKFFALPVNKRQSAFFNYSLDWIGENPGKFVNAKIANAGRFLLPGLSFNHHSNKKVILSLIFGIPLYLLAYIGIIRVWMYQKRKHSWFTGLYITMFIVLVVFLFTNRYRAYTLEPFYIIYASSAMVWLIQREIRRRTIGKVEGLFDILGKMADEKV